jgi:hypothetical protein
VLIEALFASKGIEPAAAGGGNLHSFLLAHFMLQLWPHRVGPEAQMAQLRN